MSTDVKLIAHAGGGTPWGRYSNSLEALEWHYASGKRSFEIDLIPTRDDQLVALHNWEDTLDQWFPSRSQRVFQRLGMWLQMRNHGLLSHSTFMGAQMRCGLTQLDLVGIATWLADRPDATIITDIKKEDQLRFLPLLATTLAEARHQVVVQISSMDEAVAARASGFERLAWRNYVQRIPLAELDAHIDRAAIKAVVIQRREAIATEAEDALAQLRARGLRIWVYTINQPSSLNALPLHLVDAVMTDRLQSEPSD